MNEPDWAKVLHYLYESQEPVDYVSEGPPSESQKYVAEFALSKDEIIDILYQLDKLDLVERQTFVETVDTSQGDQDRTRIAFTLSKKGFDVAHERELRQEQHNISKKSAHLSAYLVIAVILQVLSVIVQYQGWESILLGVVIIGVMLLVWIEIR